MMVQFLGRWRKRETRRGDALVPLEGSPAEEAFRTREPVILERIKGSRFKPEAVRHLTALGMQSACWVPLVHRGEADWNTCGVEQT